MANFKSIAELDLSLKPCPFCGGKAFIIALSRTKHYTECHSCGASSATVRKAETAAEHWNSRNG